MLNKLKTKRWMGYFVGIANQVASLSKDKEKVGAAIIDSDLNIIASGFNGFPRGADDAPELYANQEYRLANIIHAEQNAIAQSARRGVSTKDCAIVINKAPCLKCAGLIIQCGIKCVIYPKVDVDKAALKLLEQAEVECVDYLKIDGSLTSSAIEHVISLGTLHMRDMPEKLLNLVVEALKYHIKKSREDMCDIISAHLNELSTRHCQELSISTNKARASVKIPANYLRVLHLARGRQFSDNVPKLEMTLPNGCQIIISAKG